MGVNTATCRPDKRAGQAGIVYWFERYDGQSGFRSHVPGGVALQKIGSGEFQAVFQSENIIGGQKLIEIPAAFIETGDLRGAFETELLSRQKGGHFRFHRATFLYLGRLHP